MKNKICLKIAIAHACTFAMTTSYAFIPNTLNNQKQWYAVITGLVMRPADLNYYETLAGPEELQVRPETKYNLNGIDLLLGRFWTAQDDFSVNYTHARLQTPHFSSSGASVHTPGDHNFFNQESVNFVSEYNSVVVNIAHSFVGSRWINRVYTGVDYTQIKEVSTQNATTVNSVDYGPFTLPTNNQLNYSFNGIGPQIGFESAFKVKDRFNLIGGANVTLLASRYHFENNSQISDPNVIQGPPTPNNFPSGSKSTEPSDTIALKTQVKLGLSYDTMIKNEYPLSIEVGYKAVLVQNEMTGPDGGEGYFSGISGANNKYSFSMSGPYLGIGMNF